MKACALLLTMTVLQACTSTGAPNDPRWLVYPGGEGVGESKRVVFIAGDEEYRSEEALPMLARLLSDHHGFECIVLFSQNPATGELDPNESTNIPGLELIDDADLLVLQLRFRELTDEGMAHIIDYVGAGKPLIGIRTSTHAFNYKDDSKSPFAKWTWTSKEPPGGFGRAILGETWVSHHGHHGAEATRGVPNEREGSNPVLRGVEDVFGPTDVYTVRDLPDDAKVLLFGSVLDGMSPDSEPVAGNKNEPMLPVAWLRKRPLDSGTRQRIFATTMGAAEDWQSEDLRRLLFNAALWTLGMETSIPPEGLDASMIGTYEPSHFGFDGFRRGLVPADLKEGTPAPTESGA